MLVCVEALVTALQSIDLCSRQEAEHMFAEGVVWTQEEFDNKWKQAMKSSARAARRSYTHICHICCPVLALEAVELA